MKSGCLLMKIGIDCVEIKRIKKLMKHKSLEKVFSRQELENILTCKHSYQRASGYFAVKEAVLKALNIGLYNGLSLNKICVIYNSAGAPILEITPELNQIMQQQNLNQVEISITHTKKQAVAVCIMQ